MGYSITPSTPMDTHTHTCLVCICWDGRRIQADFHGILIGCCCLAILSIPFPAFLCCQFSVHLRVFKTGVAPPTFLLLEVGTKPCWISTQVCSLLSWFFSSFPPIFLGHSMELGHLGSATAQSSCPPSPTCAEEERKL